MGGLRRHRRTTRPGCGRQKTGLVLEPAEFTTTWEVRVIAAHKFGRDVCCCTRLRLGVVVVNPRRRCLVEVFSFDVVSSNIFAVIKVVLVIIWECHKESCAVTLSPLVSGYALPLATLRSASRYLWVC